MKHRLLLVALGAALSVGATTPPGSPPAHLHPVKYVERTSSLTIARGSTTFDVLKAIGAPLRTIGTRQQAWIYKGFHAGDAQPRSDTCDILLLTFTDGRVSDISLANSSGEQVIAARYQPVASRAVAQK